MKLNIIKYLIVFFIIEPVLNQMLFAAEVQTNWDWLTLSMNTGKTNFRMGESIAVSVTVSNVSSEQHFIPWYSGDPCNYGLGHFDITCGNSNIPCRMGRDLRAQLANYHLVALGGHAFKTFETDLTSGYDMTNSSNYSVRAVGWFDQLDNATNHSNIAVTTPPIIISLSTDAKTEDRAPK